MPQHTARRLNEQHHAMAPTKISCATCNVEFPSRNKLFQHLKDSGHGVLGLSNSSDGNTSGSGISANIGKNDLSGRNDTTNSKGNSAFYEYYLRQKICRAADDNGDNEATWKEAYQRLCTPLPMSYRIQESSWIGSDFCVDLLRSIEKQSFGCNADEDRAKIYNWSLLASRNSPNQQNGNVSPKIRMTIIPHNHNHNDSSPYLSNVVRCNEGGQNIYSSMLHALQELGAINRQELVSAIPPLVLWSANPSIDKSQRKRTDCGGKLIVADMCAAPGSKSLQLLDMLHMNSEAGETASRGVNKIHHNIPSGLLVVNDSDRNRILTLCQRLRRVPKAPMLAINVDARYFPGIRRKCKWSSRRVCNDDFKPDEDRSGDINGFSVEVEKETDKYSSTDTVEGAKTFSKEKMGYKQKYDKVLCDVPCSGDGTTRKNKQIWTSWSISHAMSLHRLQRKILRRGLELLKPGGIIVYSTCSLNPLENEAVVASVIDDIDGGVDAVEIIPLPDFVIEKCHVFNGLDSWMVPSSKFGKVKSSNKKDGKSITCQRKMYQKFDDVPKEEKSCEKGKGGTINPSMFPPASPEIRKQLRNCGRFLPGKDFDSGGFFLACMRRRKTGELNAKQQPNDIEVGVPSKVTLEKEDKHGIEGNIQSGEYLAGRSDFDVPINTSEKCVREGDWICPKCDEMNFGRRGESRCFKCKSRNVAIAKSLESTRQNQTQPLLVRPTETHSLLQSFLDFFGISSKAENPFPIDNIRIMHRSNHLTLVLASDSLSNLAISSKWAPARELGVSLASFPCTVDSEKVESISSLGNIQILDEGVPILAEHATRRHLRLDPDTFRKALAQSAIAPVATTSAAEIKRIKVTLEKCLDIGSLAGSCNWYTSLNSDSLIESWNECKANPGHFLVSCECSMESDCLDKVSIGCFSICGRIEVDGKVTIETSLRLIAAMLVAVHFYIEQVGSSPHVFNAEPVKKRRKI